MKVKHILKWSFSSVRQDYYQILNIPRSASELEIKQAYLSLAKQYHPDVSTTLTENTTDPQKFQKIAEAYAVLSNTHSKTSYDLLNSEMKDHHLMSKREYYKARGVDGQFKKEERFQAEKDKREWLAEERKRFNVDSFGRYKGGIPQPNKGNIRGNAWGEIGSVHDELMHNFKNNPTPDTQFVTREDALAFKFYQKSYLFTIGSQDAITKRKFWFPAKVDYEYFKFDQQKAAIVLQIFSAGFVISLFSLQEQELLLKFMQEDKIDKSFKN